MSSCGAINPPLAAVSAARIGRAAVGEQCRAAHRRSATRHHLTVDCLVAKPETARSAPVPQDRIAGPSCSTGRRFGLTTIEASLALLACLACLPCRCDPSDTCAGPSRNDPIVLDVSRISTTVWQRWPSDDP
jgi:hypothetical protein